jgi:hypothetical protein
MVEKWCSYRTPSWEKIGSLVDHKIWNVAFLFFIFMPVFALFLKEIPSEVIIEVNNYSYTLNFGLPFPWWLLYFAALFVSLSKAIYVIFSPSFIKQYPDFQDFNLSGRGGGDLQKTLYNLVPFWQRKQKNSLSSYVNSFDEHIHFLNSSGIKNILQNQIWGSTEESFWLVYDIANFSRTYFRLLCSISLMLAGGCFLLVIFKKIITVLGLLA